MSAYLPDDVPFLGPAGAEDEPFWRNLEQQRLTFQQCARCSRVTHPPVPVCPNCQSAEFEWIDAPAEGEVFTFTRVHAAAHDSVSQRLPYWVVVVAFPSLQGVRLVSNVVDADNAGMRIGARCHLVWERQNGRALPRFRIFSP